MYKKFSTCDYKSMKAFCWYRKYDSVTCMLLVLELPSCDTVWHNAKVTFNCQFSSVVKCSFMFLSFLP